jgi:hypothetical protein
LRSVEENGQSGFYPKTRVKKSGELERSLSSFSRKNYWKKRHHESKFQSQAPSLEALLSHCISLPTFTFCAREINTILKQTKFFLSTNKEVHDAAVAADSSTHKLTLLQQMRHSTKNNYAIALT